MASITLKQFRSNLKRIANNPEKILKNEIINIFEPIVFTYVLRTRIDTGIARKALGEAFAKLSKSQRIKDAYSADVEVSSAIYEYWNRLEDRNDDYSSMVTSLFSKGMIKVEVTAQDVGLYNQQTLAEKPSQNHKTRQDNTWRRMPPMHLTILSDIFNNSDLENLASSYILPTIAKDIKDNITILIKKIETEMFK
jgi:hypothetical protein